MSNKQKTYLQDLHNMTDIEINGVAIKLLEKLLERCTINMVCTLTKITRPTIYKWLDERLPLDAMNYRDSAWFILMCETSPRVQMLLQRAPLSNPRLAGRLFTEENND